MQCVHLKRCMRFGILLIALIGCQPPGERPQPNVADVKQLVWTGVEHSALNTRPGPLICSDSVLNDQAKSGFDLNLTYWQPCYPQFQNPTLRHQQAVAAEQETLQQEMQPVPTVGELMEENPGHAEAVVARAQEQKARTKTGRPPAQTARR